MADAIRMLMTVDLFKILQSVGALKDAPLAVQQAVHNSVQAMDRFLVADRLSKRGPDTLGVVTGTARRSIAHGVGLKGKIVEGYFGSPLRYVRAHELGFVGQVQVRAHARRGVPVRAYSRIVNMRARGFFKYTLNVGRPGVERRVLRAIRILVVTGKVPTFAQIETGR